MPWCGVLIHVACCVACSGRAVVVGVGVGVGCVWFGVVLVACGIEDLLSASVLFGSSQIHSQVCG